MMATAQHLPQPSSPEPAESSASDRTDVGSVDAGSADADATHLDEDQLTEEHIVQILQHGQIEEQGLLPYSSNYSFLVTVSDASLTLPAVYKPRRGENPLWDFESGTLCQREVAAYLVSRALGWGLVPPTVLRSGKHGIGSVQFFIHHDANEHYFTFQSDARFTSALRRLTLFDFVVNNADRKGGHCLAGEDGRLWAIDHGICFHNEYKLRTVIWEFSQEPIEDELYTDLCDLHEHLLDVAHPLNQGLCQLLNLREQQALRERVNTLLRIRQYPTPMPHMRNYPWPPV